MANTLTGLYPTIYAAMDVVSREMVGLISAVSRDASAEQAAVNQTVRSPVVPVMAASDISAGNIAASGTDQNIGYVDMVISKQRKVSFHLTGEEEKGLGPNAQTVARDRFAQAFRTLANEIELDLASLYVSASRAAGSAAANPFATADDFTSLTSALQILDENGAPTSDRHAVLNSAAVAYLLGKQPALFRVNEAGGEVERRLGELRPMFGVQLHHSGQIRNHLKGAGVGYDVDNGAGYDVGDTTIALHDGTVNTTGIKAGDIASFAGDANKYVVSTGLTSTSGNLILGDPGLRKTLADATELTIGGSYAANMVFSRDAIQLACRVPAVPSGGDQAADRTIVTDPHSGISFEISVYRQYRQVSYEVAACWGAKAVKPAHLALLLG